MATGVSLYMIIIYRYFFFAVSMLQMLLNITQPAFNELFSDVTSLLVSKKLVLNISKYCVFSLGKCLDFRVKPVNLEVSVSLEPWLMKSVKNCYVALRAQIYLSVSFCICLWWLLVINSLTWS